MRTLTSARTLAAARPYASPRKLVQIDFAEPVALTLRCSDQYVAALGADWLALIQAWGALDEALNTVDVGGRPATAELTFFNTVTIEGTGKSRLSDLIRTPQNRSGTYEFAFAKVTIYDLDAALTTGDEIVLGVFYLEDPTDLDDELLVLRMTDQSLVLEDKLKITRITRDQFPDCDKAEVGKSIAIPLGVLTNVPCRWVVAGESTTLNEDVDTSETTITLTDATDFPSSGSIMVDEEIIAYSGKSENDLTGCTRASQGTTAQAHSTKVAVYEVRTGTNAYRCLVGENVGTFKITALSNVRVNDAPAKTSPTTQLDATDLVTGKSFAVISFTPSDVRAFHTRVIKATNIPLSNSQSINSAGNSTWTFTLTPTISADAEFQSGTVRRRVTMTFVVNSGSFAISGTCTVKRSNPGGSDVTLFSDNASTFDFTGGTWEYDTATSLASETFTLFLTGDADNYNFTWTITVYDITTAVTSGAAAGESTAARVIGAVTCDLTGIKDDTTGSITGVASQLLQRPADVTKFILTELYPGVSRTADLGKTWLRTLAEQAFAGLKWAFLLEYTEFSKLRRKLGEQGRAALYLESGKWEYAYLITPAAADIVQTLDYDTAVIATSVRRTPRTDVHNSLNVYSQRDYRKSGALEDIYRRLKVHEDLDQGIIRQSGKYQDDRLTLDLVLDFVEDAATAGALGDYWLAWWKRQRFAVDAEAWWNVLAIEKIADHLALDNEPVLTAHGDTGLYLRPTGKTYPGEGRIVLSLIEANE